MEVSQHNCEEVQVWVHLMCKLVLEKAEEPDQTANLRWIIDKARESQEKTPTSALLTMPKPFFKRWEYQSTWTASWETYMQVRKQQLELDMEQQTGSK